MWNFMKVASAKFNWLNKNKEISVWTCILYSMSSDFTRPWSPMWWKNLVCFTDTWKSCDMEVCDIIMTNKQPLSLQWSLIGSNFVRTIFFLNIALFSLLRNSSQLLICSKWTLKSCTLTECTYTVYTQLYNQRYIANAFNIIKLSL